MLLEQGGTAPDFGVLAHPLRMRIVEVCTEFGGLSPTDIRDQQLCAGIKNLKGKTSKQQLSTISYHCQKLEDAGYLTHEIEKRRGFDAHVYSADMEAIFMDAEWSTLDQDVRESLSVNAWQRFLFAVQVAMRDGTFDSRLDRMLGCGPLMLDEEGWKELAVHMAKAFLGVEQGIKQRSEKRIEETGEVALRAWYGLLAFESPMPILALK